MGMKEALTNAIIVLIVIPIGAGEHVVFLW